MTDKIKKPQVAIEPKTHLRIRIVAATTQRKMQEITETLLNEGLDRLEVLTHDDNTQR